jgi:hypothetical protein
MSRNSLARFASFAAAVLVAAGCAGGGDGGGAGAGSTGNAGGMSGSGSSGSSGGGRGGSTAGADGGAGIGGGGSGGTGGTGGTDGGVKDGGSDAGGTGGSGAGGTGGGPFVCPTLTTPGTCAPPADIRCPYPKLKQTGCIDANPFSDSKIPIKMASVVVPYDLNSPLWSDGALKTRGMRLPTGGKIHVKDCTKNPTECCVLDQKVAGGTTCLPPADDGKWVFPAGTVLVKNFFFPDASRPSGYKLVETRLFIHLAKTEKLQGVSTDWVGYGYQWDDAQTDATVIGTLLDGSDIGNSATFHVTPTAGAAPQTITWDYPSRNDCITCHMPITPTTTPVSGYSLGPETVQLNRVAAGDTMNQIDKLAALSMFETAPAKPYKTALVPPYPGQTGSPPAGATLDQRARSYLHANCAFCHRPDGKYSGFDLRYDLPFKSTGICNAQPSARAGDLGVTGATNLTPKDPMKSVIWLRMHAGKGELNGARMPAIASSVVDTQGTDLISQWINSINACPN